MDRDGTLPLSKKPVRGRRKRAECGNERAGKSRGEKEPFKCEVETKARPASAPSGVQLNRFRPISDAVNSNQRSFPFGLRQTIGLITDRDKARAVAICARISDVPRYLFPPRPITLAVSPSGLLFHRSNSLLSVSLAIDFLFLKSTIGRARMRRHGHERNG